MGKLGERTIPVATVGGRGLECGVVHFCIMFRGAPFAWIFGFEGRYGGWRAGLGSLQVKS